MNDLLRADWEDMTSRQRYEWCIGRGMCAGTSRKFARRANPPRGFLL